jgi:hypothetical protein
MPAARTGALKMSDHWGETSAAPLLGMGLARVRVAGFEPAISGFQNRRSCQAEPHPEVALFFVWAQNGAREFAGQFQDGARR